MIKVLQLILGVAAGLSLVLSVIFKLVYNFSGKFVFHTTPEAFFQFTIVCCLASIALSLVELSSKHKDAPK